MKVKETKGSLDEYAARRTFGATPEPAPGPPPERAGPLLFVVQQHAARRLHYDFRLELGGVLKSWAVPRGPSLDPGEKRLAVQTEDHPFEYASFEGIIPPRQYGAGEVIVWDCGIYSPDANGEYWFHDRTEAESRVRAQLDEGKLSFFLRGEKLKGSFALVRTSDGRSWLLIKHKDRFARVVDDVLERSKSVLSGMSVGDLKRLPGIEPVAAERLVCHGPVEAMPRTLTPMRAQLSDALFTDPDWLYEPKMDGYRVIAFIEAGKARLQSRGGLDLSAPFPRIVRALSEQAANTMIVDGELVGFAAGRPSFNALQNRAGLRASREIAAAERVNPCVFYCFDLLHFAGLNLRALAYIDRRRYLAQCLLPSLEVQLVHVDKDAEALYEAALGAGFEGVVAKKKSSRYLAGQRSLEWLKVKATQTLEMVIGGYTRGKGTRARLGALLLGYWTDEGKLKYAGHVGSGIDDRTLVVLQERLKQLETTSNPFVEKPPLHMPTTWVKPLLVAEVKFAEWTPAEQLRAPVFLRLREDVDARTVRRVDPVHGVQNSAAAPAPADPAVASALEQLEAGASSLTLSVGSERLNLTRLNKVLWPADEALGQPALTKRDLLRYLARISPYMLPHLADRPLTMIRLPEGLHGERFFQKHWTHPLPPFADKITVFSETKEEAHEYLMCNNLATLLWLGQLGTLEFHVWHSRANGEPEVPRASTDYATSLETLEGSILNFPDYLVFDIDPYIYSGKEPKGAEPELNLPAFEKGKEVAFRLKELLQSMSLGSLVKTSGKTGLHVFVPIVRTLDFDAAREVCEVVARHLVRQRPKEITVEWSVPKRTGKIFIDYNMNARSKTLNVAYSPRAVSGAPVSMPLTWEELEKAHPLDFRLLNVFERLRQRDDAWRDALHRKQAVEQALTPKT
jgi:bifunctional non-homologous end joining protein LigD